MGRPPKTVPQTTNTTPTYPQTKLERRRNALYGMIHSLLHNAECMHSALLDVYETERSSELDEEHKEKYIEARTQAAEMLDALDDTIADYVTARNAWVIADDMDGSGQASFYPGRKE